MKRLIQSELWDAGKYEGEYVEVFINPTAKEIEDTKKIDHYNGIRGLINKDGNKYIWPSEIGHHEINKYLNNKIPTDYFRFTYDDSFWHFHESGHGNKMTFTELQDIIKNNLSFLSQIGDLSVQMGVQGINDEKGHLVSCGFESVNEFLTERFYE